MAIALSMICAGILPMPIVYLLRRFQILKVDLDIHQGSIRRNETTASTKEIIDQDDDVSPIHIGRTLVSVRNIKFMIHEPFHYDEWRGWGKVVKLCQLNIKISISPLF